MARKICAACDDTKPSSDFYRQHSARDGLQAYCKACAQAKKRARRAQFQTGTRAHHHVATKVCRTCSHEKPREAFGVNTSVNDGLQPH